MLSPTVARTTDFSDSLLKFATRHSLHPVEAAQMVEKAAMSPRLGIIVVRKFRSMRVKKLDPFDEYLIYHYDEEQDVVLLDKIDSLDLDEERSDLKKLGTLTKVGAAIAVLVKLIRELLKLVDGH